jgi:hypothetical protein
VRASWRCRGSVSRTGAGGEARRAPPSSPAPRRCPPPPRCSQRRSDSRARCQTRCPSPAGPRRPRRAGRPSPAVWHSGSTVFASACCCSFVSLSSEVLILRPQPSRFGLCMLDIPSGTPRRHRRRCLLCPRRHAGRVSPCGIARGPPGASALGPPLEGEKRVPRGIEAGGERALLRGGKNCPRDLT